MVLTPFRVYAAQPREGTETIFDIIHNSLNLTFGLCSSTPRGDGNESLKEDWLTTDVVYAAQPREGTETISNFYPEVRI